MTLGVGIDLCAISRVREMMTNPRFLERYFDEGERAYAAGRGPGMAASLAAGFAAKEAFCKALGTGFDGISPKDIAVLRRENGAPCYRLSGLAKERADRMGVKAIHLSLTHEGDTAAAVCLLEG